MGLFGAKQTMVTGQVETSQVFQVDQKCQEAANAVKMAIFELGQKYYDANKENAEAEFCDLVKNVNECKEKEKLWEQYKLGLEGKMRCEACGAIITSDSLFCNKCGVSIKPIDFSSIISQPQPQQIETAPLEKVCPSCGSPLAEGDIFCEKCGCKLQ